MALGSACRLLCEHCMDSTELKFGLFSSTALLAKAGSGSVLIRLFLRLTTFWMW